MLENIIVPVTRGFSYDPHGVGHLLELNIWTAHDLKGIFIILGLGFFLFFVFSRAELFTRRLPEWLSVEGLVYRPLINLSGKLYLLAGKSLTIFLKLSLFRAENRWPVAEGADFFDGILLKRLR